MLRKGNEDKPVTEETETMKTKKNRTATAAAILTAWLGSAAVASGADFSSPQPAPRPLPSDGPARIVFSPSYRGPGGHDYRTNRLALRIQELKAEKLTPVSRALADELEVRVPVILIDYPDAPATVTAEEIEERLFGTSVSPTMSEYYAEVSYGQFGIDGDVYGPYRVGTDYAAYAASDRVAFITEAVSLADADVDFSRYDSDGDGYVDGVIVVASEYIVVLGYEGAHMSTIPDYATDDGVVVSEYTSQREDASVGIFCHEFGHVLGLPDLYGFGSGQAIGIGEWGLMGSGTSLDPPPHFCAWSKIELGWIVPEEITESVADLAVPRVEDSAQAFKIYMRGLEGERHMILENRQKTGMDADLPGAGLLVWQTAYRDPSDPDTSFYENHVVLAPSERGEPGEAYGDERDPYPGSGDVREYHDPVFGIELSGISDSDTVMYVDVEVPESIDGWRVLESGVENDLAAVAFAGLRTGWVAGADGLILRTEDGGESWEEQESGTSEDLSEIAVLDTLTAWVVGAAGTVLRTADGGETWETQDPGTGEDLAAVAFSDGLSGWILGEGDTLLETVDGGETWNPVELDTGGEDLADVAVPDADSGFVAGRGMTVFCSNDAGATWAAWTEIAGHLPASTEIADLRSPVDNELWLVGNTDRGWLIWVFEGYVTCFWAGDYKDLAAFDACGGLGVAAGERLYTLTLDSDHGFGLDLFSLPDMASSGDRQLDDMEWVEIEDWADNLESELADVDVVSSRIAYVVGEDGLILKREAPWGRPELHSGADFGSPVFGRAPRFTEEEISRFEARWDLDLRARPVEETVLSSGFFNDPTVKLPPLPPR